MILARWPVKDPCVISMLPQSWCSGTQSPKVRSLPCFYPRSSAGPVHPEWLSWSFTYCIILCYRMDWSTKNLHFIIWPSGPTENGCKKTINDMMEWVSTWKGAIHSFTNWFKFYEKKNCKYALMFILCNFGLFLSNYFDKVGDTAKVLQPIVHSQMTYSRQQEVRKFE